MNLYKPIRPRGALGSVGRRGMKKGKAIFLWGILTSSLFLAIPAKAADQVEIPTNIKIYCELVGSEFNICPELLESMAYRESRFRADAINGKHYGLLQVNVKVHKDRIEKYGYTENDMLSAYPNILVAADYLSELYETYGDDNPIVLGYYSGNFKAVEAYKENGFLCEYVNDVLTRSAELERIHGR